MKKLVIVVGLLYACIASSLTSGQKHKMTQAPNTLNEIEKQEGWQLLFDGQSTSGWHKYGFQTVGSGWKISDNCLQLDHSIKDGGDIVSDEEFENFHLKVEWMIATNGNSGIMFYVHEDTLQYNYPWQTGPEMQVLDNEGHSDAQIIKHRAGDLYDLISCVKETVKPAGQWNKAEIKCLNGQLNFFLNGFNIISTTMWDDNWKQLVTNSKFKTMPGFGTFTKGKIALQDHGDNVWYRNIKIRRL